MSSQSYPLRLAPYIAQPDLGSQEATPRHQDDLQLSDLEPRRDGSSHTPHSIPSFYSQEDDTHPASRSQNRGLRSQLQEVSRVGSEDAKPIGSENIIVSSRYSGDHVSRDEVSSPQAITIFSIHFPFPPAGLYRGRDKWKGCHCRYRPRRAVVPVRRQPVVGMHLRWIMSVHAHG